MHGHRPVRLAFIVSAALAVAACVTPRMYSETELGSVERACGVAPGELLQDEQEPRLLLFLRQQPSAEQVRCVKQWSRKRRLTLALVEINWNDK